MNILTKLSCISAVLLTLTACGPSDDKQKKENNTSSEQTQTSTTSMAARVTEAAKANLPEAGTQPWFEWVNKLVYSAKDAAHEAKLGSEEWCDAIDKKLLDAKSGKKPCSAEWFTVVTETLLKKVTP